MGKIEVKMGKIELKMGKIELKQRLKWASYIILIPYPCRVYLKNL